MRRFVALATTASTMALASPAGAQTLQYIISGVDAPSAMYPTGAVEYASFQIDQSPTPDIVVGGQGFQINAVPGTFMYGNSTAPSPQNISFYTTAFNGGLFVGSGSLLAFDGPQLYTGTEAHPYMLTGTFLLTDYYSHAPINLTVTLVPRTPVVPEPASWALMIVGFGLAGAAMRARRTTVKFADA